jgi:hypothetical protein
LTISRPSEGTLHGCSNTTGQKIVVLNTTQLQNTLNVYDTVYPTKCRSMTLEGVFNIFKINIMNLTSLHFKRTVCIISQDMAHFYCAFPFSTKPTNLFFKCAYNPRSRMNGTLPSHLLHSFILSVSKFILKCRQNYTDMNEHGKTDWARYGRTIPYLFSNIKSVWLISPLCGLIQYLSIRSE